MKSKMKHLVWVIMMMTIASTVCHADRKYSPSSMSLFQMNYVGAVGTVWVDDGSEMMVSNSDGTFLVDVEKGTSVEKPEMPQFMAAVQCNDGKAVLLRTSSSVWLVDTRTWVKQQLDIKSTSISIAAIDSEGKKAIINSAAGSSIYSLESGSLLRRIPARLDFTATDFTSESPDIVVGELYHYGLVKWDMSKNAIIEIIEPYQSPISRFEQAIEGVFDDDKSSEQHLRFICKHDRNGQVLIDRKANTKLRLPYLKEFILAVPNASGTRLIVTSELKLSVVDVNSGKTIYSMKLQP